MYLSFQTVFQLLSFFSWSQEKNKQTVILSPISVPGRNQSTQLKHPSNGKYVGHILVCILL